jgi:hypothetical protein
MASSERQKTLHYSTGIGKRDIWSVPPDTPEKQRPTLLHARSITSLKTVQNTSASNESRTFHGPSRENGVSQQERVSYAEGSGPCPSPDNARTFAQQDLDDVEFRQPLEHLWDLTLNYIKIVPTDLSLLQLPCVRDEGTIGLGVEESQLLEVLHHILGASPGVRIREVLGSKIPEPSPSVWARGIIISLFCDFVFGSDILFDDAGILRECLIEGT